MDEIENERERELDYESESGDSIDSDLLINEYEHEIENSNHYHFGDAAAASHEENPFALPMPVPDFPWQWTSATAEIEPMPNDPIRGKLRNQAFPPPTFLSDTQHNSPVQLFTHTFWSTMRNELFKSTNDYADAHPHLNKHNFQITRSDLDTYFAYQMLISLFKTPSNSVDSFIPHIDKFVNQAITLDYRLKSITLPASYKKLSVKKFNYISAVLDLGPNVKIPRQDAKGNLSYKANGEVVRILDLDKKFSPFQHVMNELFRKYKNPENPHDRQNDRILSFDETHRESKSNKDQLQQYLPGKPKPYGQKYITCCDQDRYCHKITVCLPPQFKRWKGLVEMMNICIPTEFWYKGLTVVCDNYFSSVAVLKLFNDRNTSIVATWRSNRVSKLFLPSVFKNLSSKPNARQFTRKVETLYTTTIGRPIQFSFWSDKPTKKPVIIASNDVDLHRKIGPEMGKCPLAPFTYL